MPATQARSEPLDMEQMEITASRTSSDLVSATRQSTVIEHAQLEELRRGSDSLAAGQAVPGMSDSSRTITEYGQTLRGRSMLVMVDGVPLNTNRDSSRNLANIDPALIRRIEVIRGAAPSAAAGSSSPPVRPAAEPRGNPPQRHLAADPAGQRWPRRPVPAILRRLLGALDYSFDFGTRHVGASYDAHGDRIAPEPSQGDLFDSNVYNIGGKLGLRIGENQRVRSPSATTTPARTPTTPPTRGSPGCRRARSRPTRSGPEAGRAEPHPQHPGEPRVREPRHPRQPALRAALLPRLFHPLLRSTPALSPPAAAMSARSCRTAKCSAAA